MSAFDVCDELGARFEPRAEKRDRSLARPVEFLPDILYIWPRRERMDPDGTGDIDEARFFIRLGWVVDTGFDQAAGQRGRAPSQQIRARVEAIAADLRANRTGNTYEHAQITEIDYEALVTTAARGFQMDIEGYVQEFPIGS